jgi:hypothetical protein
MIPLVEIELLTLVRFRGFDDVVQIRGSSCFSIHETLADRFV